MVALLSWDAAMAQRGPRLTIRLFGGFLYVASLKTKLLEFGTMRDASADHPVFLTPEEGVNVETTLAQGSKGYELKNLSAVFTGGGIPPDGLPSLPLNYEVEGPPRDWNNLYLLTDLTRIASRGDGKGRQLKTASGADWRKELNVHLQAAGGVFAVQMPPGEQVQMAQWHFKRPRFLPFLKKIVHRQALTNFVLYEIPLTERRVVLKSAGQALMTFTAETGDITLTIKTSPDEEQHQTIEDDHALPHYSAFFGALDPIYARNRPVPHAKISKDDEGIPGDFCIPTFAVEPN